jgi:UDP-glucose 4-epimerase
MIDIFGELGTIRDYVHISDIAKGIIAILEHGNAGETYNIGSGIGRNNMEVLDLIRPFAIESGLGIELNILPERTFDVPANILDSQKLQSISGWHPEILFEEGLQRVWNSFLSVLNRRM